MRSMNASAALQLGLITMIIGFVLVFIGVLLSFLTSGKREARGAAVVFIGPIPIAFGTDKNTLLVAVLLAVGMLIAVYLMLRGW